MNREERLALFFIAPRWWTLAALAHPSLRSTRLLLRLWLRTDGLHLLWCVSVSWLVSRQQQWARQARW